MTENAGPDNQESPPGLDQVSRPPAGQSPATPHRGQISHQDRATTTPRPPTLAEQRARQEAERRAAEHARVAEAEAQRKAKTRRRLLIGGGVTVGVVAVVALIYAANRPSNVIAHCVDDKGVIVDDDYCDDGYARSHGGYSGSGGIFIYNGGRQYSYNYGGSGVKGQTITGGTSIRPKDANISTSSGKSIQRGGFGVSGGSSGSS